MIFPAIDLIKSELNVDLATHTVSSDVGNISEIISGTGGNGNNGTSDIIISLINVEENRMSRDPRNYRKSGSDLTYKNPPVHLYLTLLFTALTSVSGYEKALQNLERVISFFQKRYVFDHSNVNNMNEGIEKLVMEMVSINLEQLNHLWSILGGRYQPSVVYKMRMVTIDNEDGIDGTVIKEIETKYFL